MSMKFTVTNVKFRKVAAGKLVGKCDVELLDGALIFNGCSIFRQDDGKNSVALPAQKGQDNKWYPVVKGSPEFLEWFSEAVIDWLKANKESAQDKPAAPVTKTAPKPKVEDDDLPF